VQGRGSLGKAHILLSVICVLAAVPAFGQSREELEAFMESVADQAAGAVLPPGVDDMVAALQASPEGTRIGLILWLDSRIRAAADDFDFDRMDRYQAFRTCLDTQGADCSLLRNLQATGAWQESPIVGGGDDTLEGGQGDDTLEGGGGDDTLIGGQMSACHESAAYNYERCKAGGNSEAQCSYERGLNLSQC
jgi:hypothetical protein